ncbi:MAG: precorrin-6y C5,15-methyltransferase (decarboxylating) subunit CbiE [Alphaproteobacteria bacterium]
MTPWLAVVGIGEDGLDGLAPAARALIVGAETLVGGARHLALAGPRGGVETLTWEAPLGRTLDAIAQRRGCGVTVLATGDPMWFGIGVALAKRFPIEEMAIVPVPSAFSLACARLGWPLAEVACVTLHGRPLALLNAHLAPGARLLLLAEDGTTPAKVARALVEAGYGDSRIVVLGRMGGPRETRMEATAATWNDRVTPDLATIAVALLAGRGARVLPNVPGLPDDAYAHDGQITKREVRAATVSALGPLPDRTLWDVGAGAGSIAIEWMRSARGAHAIAIERDATRVRTIAANASALGVPGLRVIAGAAPDALGDLPVPDAVFVGGGVTEPGVIDGCWAALATGGVLVANAVTVEGEALLAGFRARHGGDLTRIAVSRAEPLGSGLVWRALAPVTQLRAVKR